MDELDTRTDGVLLAEFAEKGDQEAFAALIRRYGVMVHGVCSRVLGDIHEAQDVTQAVFLTLARKAVSLRKEASLGGWLHVVAARLAKDVRVARACRQRHEEKAMQENEPATAESADVGPFKAELDCAIAAMPERYRVPLVLFHLRENSVDDIARQLGLKTSAVGMRLSRAREMLRKKLVRRGVGVASVGALTTLLSTEAGAAVLPATFVSATVKAAGLAAAGKLAAGVGTGVVSAKVASLTKGAVNMLFIAKVKTVSLITAACLAVTGTGVVVAKQLAPASPSPSSTTKTAAANTTAPVPAGAREDCAGPWLRRAATETAAIDDPTNTRAWFLSFLASEWARLGNVTECLAALSAMEQAERARGDRAAGWTANTRLSCALILVPELVRRGQLDEVTKLYRMVCDDAQGESYESQLRDTVARALVAAGRGAELTAVVGGTAAENEASLTRANALQLAKAGKATEALAAAKSLPEPEQESVAHAIVNACLAAGNVAGLKQIFPDLPARERVRSRYSLCEAQIKQGELEGAKATVLEAVGQSNELWMFERVATALIKRGDMAGATVLAGKLSAKLQDQAGLFCRRQAVTAAAEAGDGQRAARLWEELPAAERSAEPCLSMASALYQARDMDGFRKHVAQAGTLAKSNGTAFVSSLAGQVARAGDTEALALLTKALPDGFSASWIRHGAIAGYAEAGMFDRAWEMLGSDSNSVSYASLLLPAALRQGRQVEISAWIDRLPAGWPRAQACLAAAQSCPQQAGAPAVGGETIKVFKPIDTAVPGTYGDGKWSYSYEVAGAARQGFLKYDGRDLPDPPPGDYLLTPWGWMQWQEKGNWFPVAEKPAKGNQLPDPGKP